MGSITWSVEEPASCGCLISSPTGYYLCGLFPGPELEGYSEARLPGEATPKSLPMLNNRPENINLIVSPESKHPNVIILKDESRCLMCKLK